MILTKRPPFLIVAVLAAVLAVLVLPGVADAKKKSCAQQVIDDWYGDGRVDGTYPIHCYRDAIKKLPEDAKVYSSAEGDIRRALQDRIRKSNGSGTQTTGTDTTSNTGGTGTVGTGKTGTGKTSTGKTDTEPRPDPNGQAGGDSATGDVDSASSFPVPLLVLGGLALLLLAAGGAGYLTRRLQARRGDGGPGEPPPAV